MASITLKGREIPLLYTSWEMKTIQEEIAPLDRVISLVTGRNPEDEKDTSRFGSAEHLGALAKMLRILGNAGLEEAGEAADLTDKKVMRSMRPNQIVDAINAVSDAMADGMKSEIPEKEEEGPVDMVLKELKKKDEKAG